MAFMGTARAQSAAPIPQARPAAGKPAAKPVVRPEGIAPVSKSPLPTFYANTYQRIGRGDAELFRDRPARRLADTAEDRSARARLDRGGRANRCVGA